MTCDARRDNLQLELDNVYGPGAYKPGGTCEKGRARLQPAGAGAYVHQDGVKKEGRQGYDMRVCVRFPQDGESVSCIDITEQNKGEAGMGGFDDAGVHSRKQQVRKGIRLLLHPGQVRVDCRGLRGLWGC